jgi:hypothetical protein
MGPLSADIPAAGYDLGERFPRGGRLAGTGMINVPDPVPPMGPPGKHGNAQWLSYAIAAGILIRKSITRASEKVLNQGN